MPLAWQPTAADVAAVIPQRTNDPTGLAQATFDADTVPTAAQVDELARQICAEVVAEIGSFDADAVVLEAGADDVTLGEMAKRVAAVGTASQVELSFFPEQNGGTAEVAEQLYRRYLSGLKSLRSAVAAVGSGGTVGGDVLRGVFDFPDACFGWSTAF